jgi:hypothetical protein
MYLGRRRFKYLLQHSRYKVWARRTAAGATNYKGPQDFTGIIENTVLVGLGFPRANELFRKLPPIWSRNLKNFRQPCYRPNFEEYRFEGVKFCSLSGVPTCLGPPLGCSDLPYIHVLSTDILIQPKLQNSN